MIDRFKGLLLAMCLFVLTPYANAQDYPAKPVTIVVPYTPGGPVDTFVRALGQRLADIWHQPVVVLNKPGANEIIGADYVAKSAPDGYTLLAGTEAALTMNPHLYPKLPYHPDRDFAPISQVISVPVMLFVGNGVPVSNLRELVELARRSTQKPLSYASTGAGGLGHLPMVGLERQENIHMAHVPYRGAAGMIPDVVAGQVDIGMMGVSAVEQHAKAGSLKALAISSPTRSAAMPDVPTFEEAGVRDINAMFSIGLLAPAGVPAADIQKIARDVRTVVTEELFRKKNIDAFSNLVIASSPADYGAYLRRNSQVQAERVKAANLTLE